MKSFPSFSLDAILAIHQHTQRVAEDCSIVLQNLEAAGTGDIAELQNTRLLPSGCRQLILQDVNKVECAGGNAGAMAVTTASVGSTQNQRICKRPDTDFVDGMGRLRAARQQGDAHEVPLHPARNGKDCSIGLCVFRGYLCVAAALGIFAVIVRFL